MYTLVMTLPDRLEQTLTALRDANSDAVVAGAERDGRAGMDFYKRSAAEPDRQFILVVADSRCTSRANGGENGAFVCETKSFEVLTAAHRAFILETINFEQVLRNIKEAWADKGYTIPAFKIPSLDLVPFRFRGEVTWVKHHKLVPEKR